MARAILIWVVLLLAIVVPIAFAASSPLLAWRGPVYIASGFFGVAALILLLIQPLLANGDLPGLSVLTSRRFHRWTGAALVLAILAHVIGLWITSPPDVVDVLLFRSPTPFSVWGALAMWTIFFAGAMTVFRRKLPLRYRHWRLGHFSFAILAVLCTVLHALLIEGTMEPVSKAMLCVLVLIASCRVALRIWRG